MRILLQEIEKKFNALSLRERALILFGTLSLIYGVWYVMFYDYLVAADAGISEQVHAMKDQIGQLEGQIDNMSVVVGRDPTAVLIEQVKSLKIEDQALDKKIETINKKMIPAKHMAEILRNLIDETEGLTLVSMESLETKPLFPPKNIMIEGKSIVMQAFMHGLKVEMLGGYFETLQFLKSVENKTPGIVWDELNFSVVKYPESHITIYLHTIGLDEGWISV
jgi:MSHA biogenesis protein MshJ